MRALLVVEGDPAINHRSARVWLSKRCRCTHCSLRVRIEPTVLSALDATQIGRPALVRLFGTRDLRLDAWTLAKSTLAHLPAFELEDPLHCVLVHAKQGGGGAIAKVGSASIISLMDPASSGFTFAGELVGL